jgi:hypothetical protein
MQRWVLDQVIIDVPDAAAVGRSWPHSSTPWTKVNTDSEDTHGLGMTDLLVTRMNTVGLGETDLLVIRQRISGHYVSQAEHRARRALPLPMAHLAAARRPVDDLGAFTIDLDVEIIDGTPRWRGVTIRYGAESPDFSPRVSLRHLVEKALGGRTRVLRLQRTPSGELQVAASPPRFPDKRRRSVKVGDPQAGARMVPWRDRLEDTARVYRAAGRRPVVAVADHFGISNQQASRWVRACREPDVGLLPATTRGKVSR